MARKSINIVNYISRFNRPPEPLDSGELYKKPVISTEAKNMVNLCVLTCADRLICDYTNKISERMVRRTLEVRDLTDSLSLWFGNSKDEITSFLDYAHLAVQKFENSNSKIQAQNRPIPKQKRAEITLPVTRFCHYLKKISISERISEKAAIFFAAFLDFLCIDLCQRAIKLTLDNGKKRVTHRHLSTIIKNSPLYRQMFKNCICGRELAPI